MNARIAMAGLACGLALGCGGGEEAADPTAGASPTTAPAVTPETPTANHPPIIRAMRLVPDDFEPGDRVSVEADIRDPDGDALGVSYRWTVDGQRLGDGSPAVALSASLGAVELAVEVIVDDGRGGISKSSTSATAGNRAPQVTSIAIEPGYEIRVGDEIQASFRGTDPDGQPVRFIHTWYVNDRPLRVEELTLPGSELSRGDQVTLEVIATDEDRESPAVKTKPILVVNTPPIIRSSPAGFDESGAFDYHVDVEDADGDRRLRYRLVEAPPGMTVDWLKGHISWQPAAQQDGRHPVVIEVDDQNGGVVTQSFAIEVGDEKSETPAAPAP